MLDELKELGVDVEDGSFRFMNNTELYERMLVAFAEMVKESQVTAEFDDGDREKEIQRFHSLKGAAGNLSVTPLYSAYTEIVRLLRAEKVTEAKALIEDTLPVQREITECIEKYA